MEREGQIIACSALYPFFEDRCGEVAAIAVSPECRGQGQGDKLLGMSRTVGKIMHAFCSNTVCQTMCSTLRHMLLLEEKHFRVNLSMNCRLRFDFSM